MGHVLDATSTTIVTFAGAIGAYATLRGVATLAAWLSAIESAFWGMRLPQQIVKRGLQFHAACYFPVGLFAVAIVWGYAALLQLGTLAYTSATYYLYVLCGAVILSAGYLFRMYWIAMRNMMYANR